MVRDAIRRVQAEEERIVAFRAAVAKGDAELDRGEGAAYAPELMQSITQTPLKDMRSDKAIGPEYARSG